MAVTAVLEYLSLVQLCSRLSSELIITATVCYDSLLNASRIFVAYIKTNMLLHSVVLLFLLLVTGTVMKCLYCFILF